MKLNSVCFIIHFILFFFTTSYVSAVIKYINVRCEFFSFPLFSAVIRALHLILSHLFFNVTIWKISQSTWNTTTKNVTFQRFETIHFPIIIHISFSILEWYRQVSVQACNCWLPHNGYADLNIFIDIIVEAWVLFY